jgi:predicted transcriptional regulator
VRKSAYTYHRLGLDTFDKNPDQSREIILKGLKDVKKARDINPNAILIVSFFDTKAKELANIFSEGQLPIRREAYELITTMDPTNRANYDKIIKN